MTAASAAVGLVARIAAAWLCTWALGWGLVELGREPPARLAARAAARLPPEDGPGRGARAVVEAAVARELGLAATAAARWGQAMLGAATLTPGPSWRDRRPAGQVARAGAGATVIRAALAAALALALGAAVPLAAARRRRGRATVAVAAALAVAVPTVWWCVLALASAPQVALTSTAAIAILAAAPAAAIALHVGRAVADLDRSPMAVAIAARGASRRRWHVHHAARLVAPGLAPLVGSTLGFTLAASAVVERALALPGAGGTLVAAAAVGDAPVVLTLAAASAALVAGAAGVAQLAVPHRAADEAR